MIAEDYRCPKGHPPHEYRPRRGRPASPRCNACGRTTWRRREAKPFRCKHGHSPEHYTKTKRGHHRCQLCLQARKPTRNGNVANGTLRGLVERELRMDPELTFHEIADRAGYGRNDGKGDASLVMRALGLEHRRHRDGRSYFSETCQEDTAVRIARACHIDPWEIGL